MKSYQKIWIKWRKIKTYKKLEKWRKVKLYQKARENSDKRKAIKTVAKIVNIEKFKILRKWRRVKDIKNYNIRMATNIIYFVNCTV